MTESKIQMTGTAMAVIIGVILMIAPWMIPIAFIYKLLLAILGAFLCWLGIKYS